MSETGRLATTGISGRLSVRGLENLSFNQRSASEGVKRGMFTRQEAKDPWVSSEIFPAGDERRSALES